MNNYIKLPDLKVYQLSKELSKISWSIYNQLDYFLKKITGNQFIQAVDSVGANIAEGYGRFHYLDKVRFYYNARGSLFETEHWVELMYERKIINERQYQRLLNLTGEIGRRLNRLISGTKNIN